MKPVRVLHVLHSMNRGGAENALMNYYRHVDRQKVQFDFLLTDQNKCLFEDEILSLGGKVYRVPSLTMSNPFPYLKGVRNFLLAHPEYKIIHSHTSSKSVIPLWIAKKVEVPIRVSHSHSTKSEKGFKGLVRNLLMCFLEIVATDKLACGLKAGEWLYGKQAMQKKQVHVYKNVIDASVFKFDVKKRNQMRKRLKLEDSCFLIGHIARYDKAKNHPFDVDILVEMKKQYPNVKLLEVGLGVEEGISDLAREKGVLDDIIFTGVVDNVYDYEQAMDAFLLPSFYEGLPLSIVEAQVSGLPCFTSGGVSRECSVTDLVTYIPLEQGAKVWAEKILAARSVRRIDRMGEIVASGYDASTSAQKLQHFYEYRYNQVINS